MSESHSTTTVKRDPANRTAESRMRPFTSVLWVAVLVVPLFCLVLRIFVAVGGDGIKWLIVWLTLLLFGAVLPGVAIAVGYWVTKRIAFVTWHVAFTVHLFAVAVSLSVLPGWQHVSAGKHWWDDASAAVRNIVSVPLWMVVVYTIASLCVAGSWLLYRIDAFRAATSAGKDSGGGLADLLGFPKGANIRAGSIEGDEYAVTATIDHATVPADTVAKALPALVEKANAIRGRSTIIPNERGGSSTIRLVHSDPFKDWRVWPGLSHPGLSFAYPFRTGYYSTGQTQWYSFAKTPAGLRPSRMAPKFRSENDAHMGRQGATRAGKSGDIAIEQAECLSRNDAILCLANAAKLMQDSGWCLDMAELGADTKPRARVLFAALRSLGEYRSNVMGNPKWKGRHRTWTPNTYEELGFAAVLVEVDEGDQLLNGADATWLATKGLSLGIYASVSISRAATDGMASTLRSAITQWKCFGAGQSYDSGFVLDDKTIAAGADPGAFGTRFPGAHYLDHAQGVDETLYPQDARSFKGEQDFSDLRAAVVKARATFTPATFTDGELKALGDAVVICSPRTIFLGAFTEGDNQTPSDQTGGGTATEGTDMQQTLNMNGSTPDRYDSGDPELDALMESPPEDFTAYEREYGQLPPMGEDLTSDLPPGVSGDGELVGTKPQPDNQDHCVAEFEAALVRMADRGVREFTNADVMGEMAVQPRPDWVSKRFTGLCDEGKYVRPPGLTIERIPNVRGRFLLTRLGPPPGTDAT